MVAKSLSRRKAFKKANLGLGFCVSGCGYLGSWGLQGFSDALLKCIRATVPKIPQAWQPIVQPGLYVALRVTHMTHMLQLIIGRT